MLLIILYEGQTEVKRNYDEDYTSHTLATSSLRVILYVDNLNERTRCNQRTITQKGGGEISLGSTENG